MCSTPNKKDVKKHLKELSEGTYPPHTQGTDDIDDGQLTWVIGNAKAVNDAPWSPVGIRGKIGDTISLSFRPTAG